MFHIKVAVLDEAELFADDNKHDADKGLNEEKEEGHVEVPSRNDKLPTRCKNESTLAWSARQARAEALHTLLTTVIRMEAKQYADIGQTTSSG